MSDSESTIEEMSLDRLDEIIAGHEGQKGSLIPILQEAQEVYGYLPEKVLRHVSEKTRIPLILPPLGRTYRLKPGLWNEGGHLCVTHHQWSNRSRSSNPGCRICEELGKSKDGPEGRVRPAHSPMRSTPVKQGRCYFT